MALLEKHLYLKKSTLPGAGLGLFTKIDIPKGMLIVEYKGRLVNWKDVKAEDGYNAYLFKLNSKYALNALTYYKSFARYANDARGFSKITGLKNNTEYIVKKNQCFISSIRKIYRGEEIFVPYGKAYWDLMKKINSKGKRSKIKNR
jgi:SET domain-containing protein